MQQKHPPELSTRGSEALQMTSSTIITRTICFLRRHFSQSYQPGPIKYVTIRQKGNDNFLVSRPIFLVVFLICNRIDAFVIRIIVTSCNRLLFFDNVCRTAEIKNNQFNFTRVHGRSFETSELPQNRLLGKAHYQP